MSLREIKGAHCPDSLTKMVISRMNGKKALSQYIRFITIYGDSIGHSKLACSIHICTHMWVNISTHKYAHAHTGINIVKLSRDVTCL